MTTFLWILVFAIISAIFNSVGILVVSQNKKWTDRLKNYFMCFAAGVLITSPLILALPQAFAKNKYAGFSALAGFLFMFFSNRLIKERAKHKDLAFGFTAIEGIGIHSFMDGIIYTVTFSTSILTGFLSGVGLVIHEFAEGVITYSFLIKGGFKKKKALFYAFLVAALTTPIGALIAYPIINKLNDSFLGLMLGFVAGVLIFVSASHLLPEAREHDQKHSALSFLVGIAFSVLMMFIGG